MKKHLLVVEDDALIRLSLCEALRGERGTVTPGSGLCVTVSLRCDAPASPCAPTGQRDDRWRRGEHPFRALRAQVVPGSERWAVSIAPLARQSLTAGDTRLPIDAAREGPHIREDSR